MKRLITAGAAAVLLVVALGPAALAVPAEGNGTKSVVEIELFDIPIFCDDNGETPDLSVDVTGFIQFKEFDGNGNRNLQLEVFHIDLTFTNSDGDTWTSRERGPDRVHVDSNGDVILTITGRAGSLNNIGHVVINLTTGEVLLQAGKAPFGGELFEKDHIDFACETLVD